MSDDFLLTMRDNTGTYRALKPVFFKTLKTIYRQGQSLLRHEEILTPSEKIFVSNIIAVIRREHELLEERSQKINLGHKP